MINFKSKNRLNVKLTLTMRINILFDIIEFKVDTVFIFVDNWVFIVFETKEWIIVFRVVFIINSFVLITNELEILVKLIWFCFYEDLSLVFISMIIIVIISIRSYLFMITFWMNSQSIIMNISSIICSSPFLIDEAIHREKSIND